MIRKQFLLNQNSYKKLVFLVLFNLTSFLFYGQVITGTVVDQSNETLIGASVVLKGTTIGTATDFDGNFTLDISKSQVRTLVVSFTGYKTKEVSIGNQKNFIVSLTEDVSTLGEVVVVAIGYGNKKITDLTGSVASVSTKDFQKAPVTNVEGLIANKLPGVQITPTSGKPGAGGSILIRGGSSLSATNDPLIVIDGVPVENSKSGPGILSQLNPNDIESFTVLKDASASAIYGSRASNGVVIITTKKGSSNKFDFSVSSNIRISSVIRKADVLSADQYREVVKQLGTSSTRLGNANTDWQDEIFQQAIAKEHNVSASGSIMSVLPYRASVGFLDQDGVLKTGYYKRVTALLNLSPKFFDDHLKVNVNLKGSFEGERVANEDAIKNAVRFDPTQSVFMEDQTFGGYFQYVQFANSPGLALTNPVSILKQAKNINQSFRSIGNIQLDYKMHFLPDLHLNVNAGYDVSRGISRNAVDFNYFQNDPTGGFISYKKPAKEVKNLLFESYLFYSKELKSIKSKFDITAGYSFNDFLTTNFSYPSYLSNGAINPNSYPPFPFDKPSNAIVSFYGRLNYTINEKYLLTASLRRDGSSRFSKENRWGNFPSVALAWKMKEESFLKEIKSLSTLKARLSYGVTGQQDGIDNYYYLLGFDTGFLDTQYTIGGTAYTTINPMAFNPDLKWEQTASLNLGLDFGFFDDRVSGSVDLYKKDTKDLLNKTTIPLGINFGNQLLLNIGTMENRGIEFNLNLEPIRKENIRWNMNFNATYNENKITKLTNGDDTGVGLFSNVNLVNTVGFPRNTFYLYHQVYDQNGRPIEGQMLDVNNYGQINASDRYLSNKSTLPKYLLGFSTSLEYKKWTFSTAFHANLGHYIFFRPNNSTSVITQSQVSENLNSLYYDTLFRFNDNLQEYSDFYLQDASFLKMDNINIGYNFGKTFFNDKVSLGVSASVQNVFILTKYGGIDPEATNGADNTYPIPRVFALGFNLNY